MNEIAIIYQITNLTNGKIYIGSSTCPSFRKRNHFNLLKKGLHQNKHLQAAYNKYGLENFKWDILKYFIEPISQKQLEKEEDLWIEKLDSLNPQVGYNKRLANRNLSYEGSGKIIKGPLNHKAIDYEIIDIFTLKKYIGKCVAEFARDFNLKPDSFFKMKSGAINIWGNRFVTKESLERIKFYSFVNVNTGQKAQHFSVKTMATNLGLSRTELIKVSGGTRKNLKGWIKSEFEIKDGKYIY